MSHILQKNNCLTECEQYLPVNIKPLIVKVIHIYTTYIYTYIHNIHKHISHIHAYSHTIMIVLFIYAVFIVSYPNSAILMHIAVMC